MSSFTNSLKIEILPKGSKYPYRVTEDMELYSGEPGTGLFIRCERGFEFDGTSIPRGFRWLISPSDPELLQCAASHDKVYRTGVMTVSVGGEERDVPVSRGMADSMMWQGMVAIDVSIWKRRVIIQGLKSFGWIAWNKRRKQGIGQSTETTV